MKMSENESKIVVSACLAGECCNYKGEAAPNVKVIKLVEDGKAITICPEKLGGLPTPRIAAERQDSRVVTKDGQDVTAEFISGATEALRIAQEHGCELAILKARSPSCGKGVIYDGTFTGTRVGGNGVTTELFQNNGILVKTEDEI